MSIRLLENHSYPGTVIMGRKRLHFFLCENSVSRLSLNSKKQGYQVEAWAENCLSEEPRPHFLVHVCSLGMWERSIPSGQSKLCFTLFQLYFTLSYSQSQRKKNYYSYISPLSGVPPCAFQIFRALTMQYEI